MAMRKKTVPDLNQESKETPNLEQGKLDAPDLSQPKKKVPDASKAKELPEIGNPENTVIVNGEIIEIKPTKLKYHRNRTAVFYRALEIYPLPDILAMGLDPKTGLSAFGDNRDGDKALCDWLVAVFDNEDLVRENIDEFDSELIYKILAIFRRVNKIDEMEAKLKNARTPGED